MTKLRFYCLFAVSVGPVEQEAIKNANASPHHQITTNASELRAHGFRLKIPPYCRERNKPERESRDRRKNARYRRIVLARRWHTMDPITRYLNN